MHQNSKTNGVFYYDPSARRPEDRALPRRSRARDRFSQAALTVEGKIAQFRRHLRRRLHGPADHSARAIIPITPTPMTPITRATAASRILSVLFRQCRAIRSTRSQYIIGSNHFKKMSQELRIAIAGGQAVPRHRRRLLPAPVEPHSPGLSGRRSGRQSVGQWLPGTLWLTQQERVDRDYALFGEASFDITPKITLTGGGRCYKFDNTLFGFFGFGRNPGLRSGCHRQPAAERGRQLQTGVADASRQRGLLRIAARRHRYDLDPDRRAAGTPCTNLGMFENGKVDPEAEQGSRLHPPLQRARGSRMQGLMFYATWSRGFRPGGINRRRILRPTMPDFLTNYELGWKTSVGRCAGTARSITRSGRSSSSASSARTASP